MDDGSKIKWFDKSISDYLNKTTVLYGLTGSGKSTLIQEILHIIRNHVAGGFVICQSVLTVESSDYYGVFPNNCIKTSVTPEWITSFLKKQKDRAGVYKTANDIVNLKSVFNRIKDDQAKAAESSINERAKKYIDNITNSRLSYADIKSKVDSIESEATIIMKKMYKSYIRKNKIKLEKMQNLTQAEHCCVNFLDFNPNIVLVWDDVASKFKEWAKASPEIKEIFYNGRHYYITQIISTQNDKEVDSELRKNTRVSIFTDMQAASSNFTRASNNFPKYIKQRAEMCINTVFTSTMGRGEKNHKKLIYVQSGGTDPFRYVIADRYDKVRVGCDILWVLDDKINEKNNTGESDNQFFNQYHNF
jgi:energy-coupling factor transporter ATP-binding protein EcfA2